MSLPKFGDVIKLYIGSLDETSLQCEAQFNPNQIAVDKTIAWSKHKDSRADIPHLEFTGGDGRSMSLELTFDGYEKSMSVQPEVDKLIKMTLCRANPEDKDADDDKKRPHRVVVVFGGVFPKFKGVIESVQTKYTMFQKDGTPLRATCNVKFKEADRVSFKKK